MRTLHHQSNEKLYVVGIASTAAVAALIYVIWGPKFTSKPRRKNGKRDMCPGLLNMGNSCFLNAILQSCSTSSAFRRWLEEQNGKSGDAALTRHMLKIMEQLNNEGDDCAYVSSYDVIDALRAKRWLISADEQDAHELFEVLTQSLDEERRLPDPVIPLFDVGKLEESVCQPCENRWGTMSPSLVRDKPHTYQGLLASRLQCLHCKYTCPIKYDQFDCLSLSLPGHRLGITDLTQLLTNFIKPELVEGVECEGCTKRHRQSNEEATTPKKSTFTKQISVGRLPAALCVHVQRTVWLSNGTPCKRSDHVTFPEYLCMDGYVSGGQATGQRRPLRGGRAGAVLSSTYSFPSAESEADGPVLRQTSHNESSVEEKENLTCVEANAKNAKTNATEHSSLDDALMKPTHNLISKGDLATEEKKTVNSIDKSDVLSSKTISSETIVNNHESSSSDSSNTASEAFITASATNAVNFKPNSGQQSCCVKLPQTTSGDQDTRIGRFYRLTAVIEHLGDVNSGHFVSHRRAPYSSLALLANPQWLYTSDTLVKKTRFSRVQQCTAYMLFYERVHF